MTELQKMTIKLFNEVKSKSEVKKIARDITEYTFKEGVWEYKFYEIGGNLKKAEGYNHRELIEVQF